MSLPEGFTGRAVGPKSGLVHGVRSFLREEARPPDVALYSACREATFELEDYREARPVSCLFCLVLPHGLDDAVE